MWKYLGVVVAANLLAIVSPLLAAVQGGLLLRTWFQWLPLEVHLMLLPDTELMMAALALLMIAAQFLLIVVLVTPWRAWRRATIAG